MPTTPSPPLHDTLEGPSSWALVTAVATGTVIVVLLALAVVTTGEGGENRPRATAGQVFGDSDDDLDAVDTTEVVLPWLRLDVGVGEPVSELPELQGASADVAAPVGGRFVPVRTAPAGDDPLADTVAFFGTQRPLATTVRFVLTADGKEYPIDGAGGLTEDPNEPLPSNGRTRWVAVEGNPSTVEVTVVTDGQEQTVRSDGSVVRRRAAALADLPTHEEVAEQKPVDCGSARRADDSDLELRGADKDKCTITLSARAPFVDGLGWAPKGREYLIVHVAHAQTLTVEDPGESSGQWNVTAEIDGRLGSTPPSEGPTDVNALNEGTFVFQDVDNPEQLVFEVPRGRSTGDLVVGMDVRATPDDPFDENGAERLRMEWTVPARRLA